MESHDRHDRKLVCNQQLRHGTQQAGRHSQTHTGFLYTQPRSISFALHSVGFAVIDSRWALFDAKCVHHSDTRTHSATRTFLRLQCSYLTCGWRLWRNFRFSTYFKKKLHAPPCDALFNTLRHFPRRLRCNSLLAATNAHYALTHTNAHTHRAGRLN